MERYQELYMQHEAMRARYQRQLREMRQRLEQVTTDPETASDGGELDQGSEDDNNGGTASERSQGQLFVCVIRAFR